MKRLLFIGFVSFLIADNEQDPLIKDIQKSLMAPCCWSGTVYDHGHDQMENEILAFVNENKTKAEILKYYISLHGERILSSPIAKGFNAIVWLGPPVLAFFAFVFYIVYMKKPGPDSGPIASSSPKIPFDDVIEKELEEFKL